MINHLLDKKSSKDQDTTSSSSANAAAAGAAAAVEQVLGFETLIFPFLILGIGIVMGTLISLAEKIKGSFRIAKRLKR